MTPSHRTLYATPLPILPRKICDAKRDKVLNQNSNIINILMLLTITTTLYTITTILILILYENLTIFLLLLIMSM